MTAGASRTKGHKPRQGVPASPARTPAATLAILLLLSVLAACSSTSSVSGEPTGGPSPISNPPVEPTVAPSGSVPGPPPSTSKSALGSITVDGTGEVTPGYLDIVRMRVQAVPEVLTLSLDLAAAVPTGSPEVGQLAYMFYLDVDADGVWDYSATLSLVPESGFRPTLTDRRTGQRSGGPDYPGTATLADRSLSLTVQLEALGCPATVRVRGASEQTKGGAKAGDQVPDATGEWIAVTTRCTAPEN
jgi:hypothetical protein